MTNRKAAPLSGTLLARKGAARPADFSEPSRRDFVSGGPGPDSQDDEILDPGEVLVFKDGAALAPELLNVRPVEHGPGEHGLGERSTALSAGPRPGARGLWRSGDDVTELSQEQPKSWVRTHWRLVLFAALIIAAAVAGLYARASSPPETAQGAVDDFRPPVATQSVRQAGLGTARVTLPPPVTPEPPNPDAAPLAAVPLAAVPLAAAPLAPAPLSSDTGPIEQEFAALSAPLKADIAPATPVSRDIAPPISVAAVVPAKALVVTNPTPDPAPSVRPSAAGVAETGLQVAARLPRQKPDSPLSALLADAGDGVFVQLGSLKSAVGAKREWDKLVQEFPGVLSGRPLSIERVALANRGAFYRIRTGPISGVTRARAICAEFTARDRGCLVVRQ